MSSKRHVDSQNSEIEASQQQGRVSTDSQTINQSAKPELLKNGKLKLLILLLCVVSFYAGWQASRSYLVKECHLAGAIVSIENDLVYCSMP